MNNDTEKRFIESLTKIGYKIEEIAESIKRLEKLDISDIEETGLELIGQYNPENNNNKKSAWYTAFDGAMQISNNQNEYIKRGLSFKSEKQSIDHDDQIIALARLKKAIFDCNKENNNWRTYWDNENQPKFYIYFNHDDKIFGSSEAFRIQQYCDDLYFRNKDCFNEIKKLIGGDWKIVLKLALGIK